MASERNNGRPMPWEDTATCTRFEARWKGDVGRPDGVCGGPMVPVRDMPNGYSGPSGSRIACAACGEAKVGTTTEVAKVERAHRAFELLEAGTIHADRGCQRCNGPLPLDRERLCATCVEKDNRERQASLFPEVR
jgi:hypothetical protein